MILSWNGYRFNLRCLPSERDLPQNVGLHWDSSNKVWWTGLLPLARVFEYCADGSAKQRFSQEDVEVQLSRATDSSIIIPAPDGRAYLPFQKAGVAYASRRKNTLIGDEMGLGKSIQTIGLINLIPEIKRILLIVPASLRLNWSKELLRWSTKQLTGGFAYGPDFPDTNIVIINYELVRRHRQIIDSRIWDLVVMDECFPYSTIVTTEAGDLPIGEVVEKNLLTRALSYNTINGKKEWKKITKLLKKEKKVPLVKVIHELGEFTCTANHPIWVGNKYKEAQLLSRGDILSSLQEDIRCLQMRQKEVLRKKLRGAVHKLTASHTASNECSIYQTSPYLQLFTVQERSKIQEISQNIRKILLEKMLCAPQSNTAEMARIKTFVHEKREKKLTEMVGASYKENERGQSNEEPRFSQKDEKLFKRKDISEQRRERKTDQTTTANSQLDWINNGIPYQYSTCCRHVPVTSNTLLSRSSSCRKQDSNRNRWTNPYRKVPKMDRQEENFCIRSSRVVSVEVLEQGSRRESFGGSGKDQFVYCLEVEDNHNFFADNILVSNCHYLKGVESQRTKSVLGYEITGEIIQQPIDCGMRLFLTGTAILNRPAELWPMLRVADPNGLGSSQWGFYERYCLPSEAPILMSDLSEKQISEVKIGDKVIGWERKNHQRRLCVATVLDIVVKEQELQRVDLNDGTHVICTPDHKWLCERRDFVEYSVAKVGKFAGRGKSATRMVRIIDSGLKHKYLNALHYKQGYLIGFFRGDGWCSKTKKIRENPFKESITSGVDSHTVGCSCKDREPILRCHEYLTEFNIQHREPYLRADEGWEIDCGHADAYDFFTSPQPNCQEWWAGFLGGVYDAEGSHGTISQSLEANPVTYRMIREGLNRFKIKFSENKEGFNLKLTRDEWLDFWFLSSPAITRKMRLYLFGVPSRTGFGENTKIVESFKGSGGKFMKRVVRPVKITPLQGIHKVYTLTTTTGNYVAYGVGSKNCRAWNAPWGTDISGSSNLEELQARLRCTLMIRRLKKDVLSELPPKRRQIIPIPAEKARKAIKEELDFYEGNQEVLDQAMAYVEKHQGDGSETSYKLAVSKLDDNLRVRFDKMAALRYKTAMAKLPFVIEHLENCLENEEKVFCFAHHRDVIDGIVKHFGNIAVKHYGGMSTPDKQKSVDRFDEDPKCRLFVAGITTAQGYSATKSTLAVGAELDWRPAIVSQAEDRLHRIGQQTQVPVNVQHIVFDGSLDARMAQVVVDKQEIVDKALG